MEYNSRKSGSNYSYSEQNLVDCDNLTYGCGGGWPTSSFYYIRNEGISNGSTYTYEGYQSSCRTSLYPPVANISNVCEIDVEDNEENLKKIVGTVGPVASVITATDALFNYGKGVFYDPTCKSDAFDHAIVRFA